MFPIYLIQIFGLLQFVWDLAGKPQISYMPIGIIYAITYVFGVLSIYNFAQRFIPCFLRKIVHFSFDDPEKLKYLSKVFSSLVTSAIAMKSNHPILAQLCPISEKF